MKFQKLLCIILTAALLLSMCACTSGPSVQTTPSAGGAQTTAATAAVNDTISAQIISYDAHYDENSELFMYYVSTMGELVSEVGRICQEDGLGASLITTAGEIETGKTGADLLEANLDRSKTILAEVGEDQFAFYETSDDGTNHCYFSLIVDENKTVSVDMTFPTDARDTYFQHFAMLLLIYLDVYVASVASAE